MSVLDQPEQKVWPNTETTTLTLCNAKRCKWYSQFAKSNCLLKTISITRVGFCKFFRPQLYKRSITKDESEGE